VRKGRIILFPILVALFVAIGYRVYRLVTEKKPQTPKAAAVLVRAAPVESGTIRRDIRLTGDIEALTSVQVFPKSPGRMLGLGEQHLQRARELYKEGAITQQPLDKIEEVDEGDTVQKGQIISVVDHENLDAAVNQAKAALTTAEAQLKQAEVARAQAEKDRERIRNLQKEGAASKQALEKIEAEYENLVEQENVAKARGTQSQAALNQAQIQLGECFITAPISGIISHRYLETGDMAMVTRPIFAIIDVDKVKITADLPQRYLSEVHKGGEASIEVDAFPGRGFQGSVTNISPVVNMLNRTAALEITVDNPEHLLKPGMFTRVTLNIARKEGVLVIAEAAVLRDEAEEYVFVVEGNSVARRRKVVLGLEEGPRVEVTDGLHAGEMLVVAGQQKISDGEAVQVQK
jgi:RND family efflux transporter MFP subunit